MADHAIEALSASRVKEVSILGRRGPVQAAFTTVEVRELGELPGADVIVRPEEVAIDDVSAVELAAARAATRAKVAIVQEFSRRAPAGKVPSSATSTPSSTRAGRRPTSVSASRARTSRAATRRPSSSPGTTAIPTSAIASSTSRSNAWR